MLFDLISLNVSKIGLKILSMISFKSYLNGTIILLDILLYKLDEFISLLILLFSVKNMENVLRAKIKINTIRIAFGAFIIPNT
ncbi:hypothetical protein, partial [Clostridioides difficile]|uniref:hypothetical protein n=1 Tax=Clostridioides difficile TaxID=1496 RepID=UPI001F43C445